jgi:hypothetical protein
VKCQIRAKKPTRIASNIATSIRVSFEENRVVRIRRRGDDGLRNLRVVRQGVGDNVAKMQAKQDGNCDEMGEQIQFHLWIA